MDSIAQSPVPSKYLYNPNSLLQSTNEIKFKTEDYIEDKSQLNSFVVMDTKKQRNVSESEFISKPKVKVLKKIPNTVSLGTNLENKTDAKQCVKAEPMLINQEVNSSNITGKYLLNDVYTKSFYICYALESLKT